jgi:archaellum component FlaC
MAPEVNNWGPAALIVFGYMAAAIWQNKRIDDIGKRFDDIKDWVKAEFGRVHDRLDRIDKTLEKLDTRVKVLEDESAHW